MSLYSLQKFLYHLNRDARVQQRYADDLDALLGMPWADYIEAMREGVRRHGPVRAGIYAMTTSVDEKVAGV
jgi:hypothetical protein